MENMTLADYAAVRDIECRKGGSWGYTAAIWVLVAAVIVFAIVYNWTKNCNEKVQFANGLARLDGRLDCLEPQVKTLNGQMYGAAQTFAGLVTGVSDIRESYGAQIDQLNKTIFFNPAEVGFWGRRNNSCGCGCGTPNRIFAQTQTYTPKDQQVTVTETCGSDRC